MSLPLMIFAAGKGTRMAPLTDVTPKPLIPVAGRTLLDRALDLGQQAGTGRVVVNIHHLGGQIRHHIGARATISDETERLLETGGGLTKALPLLKTDPFLSINADNIWIDGPVGGARLLAERWDDEAMDALLLLIPLALLAVRTGRLREVTRTAVVAVGVWLAVNLPIMVLFPRGWSEFFRLNTDRPADPDSIYNVITSFTGWQGFDGVLGAGESDQARAHLARQADTGLIGRRGISRRGHHDHLARARRPDLADHRRGGHRPHRADVARGVPGERTVGLEGRHLARASVELAKAEMRRAAA